MSFSRQEIAFEARSLRRRAVEKTTETSMASPPPFAKIGVWKCQASHDRVPAIGDAPAHDHWILSLSTDGSTKERDWEALGMIAAAVGAPEGSLVTPLESTHPNATHYWMWSENGECPCLDRHAMIVDMVRRAVNRPMPGAVTISRSREEELAAVMRPDGKMTRKAFDMVYDMMKEAGHSVDDREEGWQKCLASGAGIIDAGEAN